MASEKVVVHALIAAYVPMVEKDATDETLRMAPWPRSRIGTTAAWLATNTARIITSSASSWSATSLLLKLLPMPKPALLTSRSIG